MGTAINNIRGGNMLNEYHWGKVVGTWLIVILAIGTAAFGLYIWRVDKRDEALKQKQMQVQAQERKQKSGRKKSRRARR
jgi:UPF0716 family protein affecting phage T7 exclusion